MLEHGAPTYKAADIEFKLEDGVAGKGTINLAAGSYFVMLTDQDMSGKMVATKY